MPKRPDPGKASHATAEPFKYSLHVESGSCRSLMEKQDPWFWTVDQVVQTLCLSRELWSDRPSSVLPKPNDFESVLRRNEVDGPTLLQSVTPVTLKDEFGIHSLGQRSAIQHALEKLRSTSSGFANYQASLASGNQRTGDIINTISPLQTPPQAFDSVEYPSIAADEKPQSQARVGEILVESKDGGDKRRKLVLNPTASNERPIDVPAPTSGPEQKSSYLGKSKLGLDETFFGLCSYGEVLPEDDSDEAGFSFSNQVPVPPGRRILVNKLLRHTARTELQRLDDSSTVFYPYSAHLVADENTRSAILFRKNTDQSLAITKWSSAIPETPPPDLKDNENYDWDYLLSNWKTGGPHDEIIPAYDESGSEADDEGSLLLDEYEEDQREREAHKAKYLSREQVAEAVDEAVLRIEQGWLDRKVRARERVALKTWKKSQGRQRQVRLDQLRRETHRLDVRFNKMRDSICEADWKGLPEIQKQCEILEGTVRDKSDLDWEMRLLKREKPPTAPTTAGRQNTFKKPRRKPQKKIEEENDLLSASPEGELSDNEEHFMDVDDIPKSVHNLEDGPEFLDEALNRQEPNDTGVPQTQEDFHLPLNDQTLAESENLIEVKSSSFAEVSIIDDRIEDVHDQKHDTEISPFGIPSDVAERYSVELDRDDDLDELPADQMASWPEPAFEEHNDRVKLVMDLFNDCSPDITKDIQDYIQNNDEKSLCDIVSSTLATMTSNVNTGMNSGTSTLSLPDRISRVFLSWLFSIRLPMNPNQLLTTISLDEAQTFLEGDPGLRDFYDLLFDLAFGGDLSSDDEEDEEDANLTKKRRKLPAKSQKAIRLRDSARKRRDFGLQREMEINQHLLSNTYPGQAREVMINICKKKEDEPIYINPAVAARMKPYQIDGVRFMWRELIDSDASQGCLLAHTMGLGKTMQTIIFLNTVAEVARSKDPRVSQQLPTTLRTYRTLILCPAGILHNWQAEFQHWTPKSPAGANTSEDFYEVGSHIPQEMRGVMISSWAKNGGNLMMSFEMFRNLATTSSKSKTIGQEQLARIRSHLLADPSIVVADEAHKVKSPDTEIGSLTSNFETTCRIALTGTPLANNLMDYFHMVDWIAPGYLGPAEEFKSYFQYPIEHGFYHDSSAYDRRYSLKKLQLLKEDIDPKVSRADISVLKGSLPSKSEFVIYVELSSTQKEAYTTYVQSLHYEGQKVSNTNIFYTCAMLGLLCAHPLVFNWKLDQRHDSSLQKTKNKSKPSDMALLVEGEGDATGSIILPEALIKRQEKLFRGLRDSRQLGSLQHSYKMAIVDQIVQFSLSCGDKVLIFSHHLLVLDYLGIWLGNIAPRPNIERIDGSTTLPERVRAVMELNQGSCQILLLSTKACGVGLNLQGANRVIIMDFLFNPQVEEQAIGRSYRIGQRKPVFVYQLVTGHTFESAMFQKTVFKRQLALRVVDKRNVVSSATKIRDLVFEPEEMTQEDLGPFKGKDAVLDRVLSSEYRKAIRKIATSEVLHAKSNEELTAEELKEVEDMKKDNLFRMQDRKAWEQAQSRYSAYGSRPMVQPNALTGTGQQQAFGGSNNEG